jgi:hypothetical protein
VKMKMDNHHRKRAPALARFAALCRGVIWREHLCILEGSFSGSTLPSELILLVTRRLNRRRRRA